MESFPEDSCSNIYEYTMTIKIPLKNKILIAMKSMRLKKGPRFASLFVTRKCNLKCPYCKSIDNDFIDMTLDQWKAAIDRLHEWGVRIFSITGGEPLIRKDITDIARYIATDKKSICWMISNFGLMDEKMIDRLSEAGMQFVTCSLDSLSGNSDKSDHRYLDLMVYAKSKGIIASTLTVITSKNIDEVPDILHTVTQKGIMFDMGLFQHVGGIFSPSDKTQKPGNRQKLEKILSLMKNYKIRTGLVSPGWTYLNENIGHYDEMNWKCAADRDNYIVVNNNGNLMTCQEYADGPNIMSMNKLDDPAWRQAKKSTVEKCGGCFYGCYYQKSRIQFIDALFDTWSMLRV